MTPKPTCRPTPRFSLSAGAQLAAILTLSLLCATVLWRSGAGTWSLSLSDPAQFVTGCLRIAGLVVALWLGSVTVLAVVLRLAGARLASRMVERLLPSMIRRLVHLSCGVTIVGVLMGGPTSASMRYPGATSTTQPRNHAVAGDPTNGQRWPEINPVPASSSPVKAPLSVPSGGVPSIPAPRRQPPTTSAPTTPAPTTPAASTVAQAATVPIADPVSAATISTGTLLGGVGAVTADHPHMAPSHGTRHWTVERGDHFWNIAERVVSAARPGATEHQIARYWLALIEVNRSRLDDPHNPDLLRIGTYLLIPNTFF